MRMIASALAVVLVASVSAISPASADLYDEADAVADIRLQPVNPAVDAENQPAVVLQPGAQGAAISNQQLFIQNQWVSGDRVLVQLFDSAENNCSSVPTSVGYAAAPTVAVSPTPLALDGDSPWAGNNGSPDTGGDPDAPDTDLGIENSLEAPTFNVQMLSSPGCEANDIHDIMAIQLTNESQDGYIDAEGDLEDPANIDNTATWVFTISGVTVNVGTNVEGGPLRAVPFGQNATTAPGTFANTDNIFGGNQAALQADPPSDVVANLWTNPAYIVPVTLEGELDADLVADSSIQPIGEFTFAESQNDAWSDGPYQICFTPGISDLQNSPTTPLAITTSPATLGLTVTITSGPGATNNCLSLEIAGASDSVANSITISNIFGRVNTPGTKSVQIQDAETAFVEDFLTPDDQTVGTSDYSDVNAGGFPLFPVALGPAEELPDRIGGNNRYETAAKIAMSAESCANFAVLVNGNSFPDALSASYLAGALAVNDAWWSEGGWVPILTTPRDQLSPHTIQAIRELGVRTVYIVGGTAAITASVQSHVESLPRAECGGDISDTTQNVITQRYSGPNRYLTNKAVVQAGQNALLGVPGYNNRLRYQSELGETSKRTVLVASGEVFADALSAAPYAHGNGNDIGFPLVLTTGGALSASAADTMRNLDIEQAVIVGGTAAVSTAAEQAIQALGVKTIRISGPDRYITNAVLNGWAQYGTLAQATPSTNEAYDYGLGWSNVATGIPATPYIPSATIFLARGDDYADALAVSPLVGWSESFLVLTPRTSLHPAAGIFIGAVGASPLVGPVIAIGLGAAISTATLNAANAALNP